MRREGVWPHPPRGRAGKSAAKACAPIRRKGMPFPVRHEGVRPYPPRGRSLEMASIKMCGPGGHTGTSPRESVASNSKNGSHKVV